MATKTKINDINVTFYRWRWQQFLWTPYDFFLPIKNAVKDRKNVIKLIKKSKYKKQLFVKMFFFPIFCLFQFVVYYICLPFCILSEWITDIDY